MSIFINHALYINHPQGILSPSNRRPNPGYSISCKYLLNRARRVINIAGVIMHSVKYLKYKELWHLERSLTFDSMDWLKKLNISY